MAANTLRVFFVFFVVALLSADPLLAQQRAAITGTLTDSSGAVVPGAVVDALAGGNVISSATSGGDGRYRLDVPAGQTVTVRARLHGFAEETADVTAAGDAVRDLTLRVAAVGDTLVVTAARTAETRLNTMASVAVFDADDIQALGSTSIADILRFVPGLGVESTGREGALTSLFARGGESDYNLVLVDGVRVNDTGGTFDFSRIPAADIDRVEIVRGGQSSLYGSDAMGAVVQIFTRRAGPSDPPHVTGAFEGGSFNTWRGDATLAGGASSRVDYNAGLSYRGTDGAFADILPEDDEFDQAAFHGGVGLVLGNRATVRTGLRYGDASGRSPGPINFNSRDTGTEQSTTDLSWHLSFSHRVAATLTGDAAVSYSRSDRQSNDLVQDPTYDLFAILEGTPGARFPASPRLVRFVDQAAFNALAAGQQPLAAGQFLATTPFGVGDFTSRFETRFRRPGFKYHADWMWRPDQSLTAGYEFERESDPGDAGFEIGNHAWFVQQQFRARERFVLTLGARVDDNSHFGTNASPKLSVGGFLVPLNDGRVSSLKVFSNVGSGIKNPTFDELFGSPFADGNPDLAPERARTIDIGAEASFAAQRFRTGVAYFDNDYDDQVAFRSTGFGRDNRPDFVNIAGSKATGVELEAAMQRPLGGLTAAVTYAFVDTEVTATTSTSEQFQPGQPLLRRPRHSGTIRFGYTAGPATVNVDARMVGQRHDAAFLGLATVPGNRPVDITVNPGYTVVGVAAEYRVREQASVYLRLDNLANEEYESAIGYPGMPRAVMAGVRFGLPGR
jgi:vitamin B12 transporter